MAGGDALKGLKGFRVFELEDNTQEAYTPGAMTLIPEAQALTKTPTRTDNTVYADDAVYDVVNDFQYTDLVLTVAELPTVLEALLTGATYDNTDGTLFEASTDVAPEFALGFAALKKDGTYRMFKYYCVKVTLIEVSHATKGDTGEIQPYNITLRATTRKADSRTRGQQDTKESTPNDLSWLDTMDAIPAQP